MFLGLAIHVHLYVRACNFYLHLNRNMYADVHLHARRETKKPICMCICSDAFACVLHVSNIAAFSSQQPCVMWHSNVRGMWLAGWLTDCTLALTAS